MSLKRVLITCIIVVIGALVATTSPQTDGLDRASGESLDTIGEASKDHARAESQQAFIARQFPAVAAAIRGAGARRTATEPAELARARPRA